MRKIFTYIKNNIWLSITVTVLFIFFVAVIFAAGLFIKYDKIVCDTYFSDNKMYCKTDKIKFDNTVIKFPGKISILVLRGNIDLENLDTDLLKYFQNVIKKKEIKNSHFIFDKNKRELANLIIENFNSEKNDNKKRILQSITKTAVVNNYIKNADVVKKVDYNMQLKTLGDTKINYVAIYNSEIFNYYSDEGALVLREYYPDGKLLRYQIFDKKGNFYTYDASDNLVEYNDDRNVYNREKKLLYVLHVEDEKIIRYSRFSNASSNKRKIYICKNGSGNYPLNYYVSKKIRNIKMRSLLKKLNNTESAVYKELTPVIDKYYDKGSITLMVAGLNNYFNDLKKNDSKHYGEYQKLFGEEKFTLNFSKYDGKYVFAINNSDVHGVVKVASSMAGTMNRYNGRCSEPNLKATVGNNNIGRYFYDIKVQADNKNLSFGEHVPCEACSINTSLWGWKYPFKS